MNVVANNIKRILAENGIKHKYAAQICGYSEQTLSAMINGRKLIKVEDVIAICRGLQVTPNDLYKIEDKTA